MSLQSVQRSMLSQRWTHPLTPVGFCRYSTTFILKLLLTQPNQSHFIVRVVLVFCGQSHYFLLTLSIVDIVEMRSFHRRTCLEGISHTQCPYHECLKKSGVSLAWTQTPLRTKDRGRGKPSDVTACPGWQRLCSSHTRHRLVAQWYPCLHRQVLLFLLSCVGAWKKTSKRERERETENGCELSRTFTQGHLGSRSLTFVAVRLKLTLGLLGVALLVFVPLAALALRLLTVAQRGHVGACCAADD